MRNVGSHSRKLQPRARSQRKGTHFLTILVLACLVRCYDGDVGLDLHSGNGSFLRRELRLRGSTTAAMSTWELILGPAGAVLLTAYLVYALLRPERF